jgi:DNA replication protein DnaC
MTRQLLLNRWHIYLGDPIRVNAILDRLVHAARRISRKGESKRKKDKA